MDQSDDQSATEQPLDGVTLQQIVTALVEYYD